MVSTAGQVIKCKAAVAWKAREPLVIEEVEVAPPQAMEVRIKILFTTLCHTDIYYWKAKECRQNFPRIFGHEAGGIVESIGEDVTNIAPEDHVLVDSTEECKTDSGVMFNDFKTRFSIKKRPIYHFLGASTFSEYTVVDVRNVIKIDPEAPLNKVCILCCGISTGLSAALNAAKPPEGSSVAIFGLGEVGLAAAEGARIAGASRIIGIDMNPKRLINAKKFGFDDIVNPFFCESPIQEVLVEMTDGGVDRSIECTGNTCAMISAFECVHDGRAILVDVFDRDGIHKIHPFNLLQEGILERKSFGNKMLRYNLYSFVDMCLSNELDLEKYITHEVPFSEINKAFDYMHHGDCVRCVIRMDA